MEDLTERLADIHRNRRWIIAADAAAAATDLVEQLREWGAAGVMVVAATEGVGTLPDVSLHFTRTFGPTIMLAFRAFFRSLAKPSAELREAVETFDPDGSALVIGPPFGDFEGRSLLGRSVYGARRPEWGALEDKTVVDDLWDAAGIPRESSEVVPVAAAPEAALRLAGPFGTVWVADNSGGWHGGGDYTQWVWGEESTAAALEWFSSRARAVRVMPFLDGLPCSIHGFVGPQAIGVFRPVEIVILRRLDRPGFVYAGAATFWDPPDDIRRQMREVAAAVAVELRRRVGYRGPFGIDGVCTEAGFRPTELNPRLSAGLGMQAACADLPLGSITRAFLAGDLEVDPSELEKVIVEGADRKRIGGMGLPLSVEVEPAETGVRFGDEGAVAVAVDDDPDATMVVGSSPTGSWVRLRLDAERIRPGRSVAPLAAQAAEVASRLWGFEMPPVGPAPDVCRPKGLSR